VSTHGRIENAARRVGPAEIALIIVVPLTVAAARYAFLK
jgi:hypothetical protein